LGVFKNHPVCLSVIININSSLTDKLILMKLYTVVVYNLRMCMKEDNPGLKNIKRETNNSNGGELSFVI